MWVARDRDNDLYLYRYKPYRFDSDLWMSVDSEEAIDLDFCMQIDKDLFPELKWEDNPIETNLVKIN